MILLDIAAEYDEEDDLYLIFRFDGGTLAFECPIGSSSDEALSAFKTFVETAETMLVDSITMH